MSLNGAVCQRQDYVKEKLRDMKARKEGNLPGVGKMCSFHGMLISSLFRALPYLVMGLKCVTAKRKERRKAR